MANSGLESAPQPVADDGERLALAEPVRDPAREQLGDRGGCFADAFDEADHLGAGPEHGGEEHRQQTVDHLRGDVHEQADEAERPHAARHCAEILFGGAL